MLPNLNANEFPLRKRHFCAGAFLLLFSSANAVAQSTAIELQDQAGQTLTTIDLLDSSSVTINPMTGDLVAVPVDSTVCSGSGECDATVVIESFTINPASVTQGGTFTAVFDERGAYECSRSGLPGANWNAGFQDPDSNVINVNVGATVATGDYDLVLTCRNGTSSPAALATFTRTLAVTEPDSSIPQVCIDEGRLAPSSWQRELNPLPLSPTVEIFTWTQFFGNDFPAGNGRNMRVRPDRYLALEFNTATAEPSGRVGFSDLGGNILNVSSRSALVTMSDCPGDFAPQADVDCRLVDVGTNAPAFRWTRTSGTPFQCELPSNADYYFNVTFVSNETEDNPDPNQLDWQCDPANPTNACGWRLQTFTN